MRPDALLAEIGRRLSTTRKELGLTMTEVSARANVRTRYLRMAEAGQANLSILKLAALAKALRLPLRELCDIDLGGAPELRLALLGLRGAGKSTVGRALAQELEVPFVELDKLVEESAGLPLSQIFTLHGESYYRQLQRESLENWLAQNGTGILATGGSIVDDEAAFDRLRATCRTVWLRATPDEHWNRVIAQGDLRPIRNHPRARAELESLLETRTPKYSTADLVVDTTDLDPRQVAGQIAAWATS
jgi:XRE family aerobic/anaerobic benzoate catabolism transcriptional regulator